MKFVCFLFTVVVGFNFNWAQNVAEKLGYPPNSKLLIIHADDLGVTHSENRASLLGMREGCVNSASIMAPCPWFLEIAKEATANPDMDLGIHLTLNSEWANFKWGPVSSKNLVSSLVDSNGYFFDNVQAVAEKGDPEEVQLELMNQVAMAFANNIDVTHLDAHMGAALSTREFLQAYLEVGNRYRLPVLLDKRIPGIKHPEIAKLIEDGKQVFIDNLFTAYPEHFESGMASFYKDVLNNLETGFNVLLIHLAFNDAEMQGVTIDHPNWGAAWRQADLDFFKSEACAELIAQNNIVLVEWREIRDKIIRVE